MGIRMVERFAEFLNEHETLTTILLLVFIIPILSIWFILATVEEFIMYLKGYSWNSGWGGYYKRQ
jgi:hypothetical protein